MRQRALETANEPHVMHRQQGAIDVLRKLKLLKGDSKWWKNQKII